MLVAKLLLLLLVANGAPIIARHIFGRRFSHPVDGNLVLADGQRLFGPSKTIRGVVLSIAASLAFAVPLEMGWNTGLVAGAGAMLGDLLSSFIKRRLKKPPRSMALGLDQVPESLVPALACSSLLPLTVQDIVVVVLAFVFAELLLSKILYRLHIRLRPY
jgi:CDP-2,3-bis-(O-geranylgeranyl)-sn-glycerol synthase